MFNNKKLDKIVEFMKRNVEFMESHIQVSRDLSEISRDISESQGDTVDVLRKLIDLIDQNDKGLAKNQSEIISLLEEKIRQDQEERKAIFGYLQALEKKIDRLSGQEKGYEH